VFRWMAHEFLPGMKESDADQPELEMPGLEDELKKKLNRPVPDLPRTSEGPVVEARVEESRPSGTAGRSGASGSALLTATFQNQGDAPTCPYCGHIAVRNGACHKCLNCGESLGCS
jgi:ribonucleoside-diphosphate reductase alpha chain